MTKKVAFGTKPPPAVTPDQWVESRTRDFRAVDKQERLIDSCCPIAGTPGRPVAFSPRR
jgi:hypothetical protein